MPIKETEVKEKKFLQQKRLDVSMYDTPVTSWDYFDALTNSAQSKIARDHGEVSTDLDLLEKYLKLSTKSLQEDIRKMQDPSMNKLPPYIYELVRMQEFTGKWQDLSDVLRCIGLPLSTRLNLATPWEMASAFALAAIRQQIEFYPELSLVHDKGIKYFPTPELLVAAREVIAKNKYLQDKSMSEQPLVSEGPSNILTEEGSSVANSSVVDDTLNLAKSGIEHNFETQLGHKDEWTKHIHGSFFVPTYHYVHPVEPKPKLTLFNEYPQSGYGRGTNRSAAVASASASASSRIGTANGNDNGMGNSSSNSNPFYLNNSGQLGLLSVSIPRDGDDSMLRLSRSRSLPSGDLGGGSGGGLIVPGTLDRRTLDRPSGLALTLLGVGAGDSRGRSREVGSQRARRFAEKLERMEKEGVDKAILNDMERISKAWTSDLRLNSRESVYNKLFDASGMPLAPYTPKNFSESMMFTSLDFLDEFGNADEDEEVENVEEDATAATFLEVEDKSKKKSGKKKDKSGRHIPYERKKSTSKSPSGSRSPGPPAPDVPKGATSTSTSTNTNTNTGSTTVAGKSKQEADKKNPVGGTGTGTRGPKSAASFENGASKDGDQVKVMTDGDEIMDKLFGNNNSPKSRNSVLKSAESNSVPVTPIMGVNTAEGVLLASPGVGGLEVSTTTLSPTNTNTQLTEERTALMSPLSVALQDIIKPKVDLVKQKASIERLDVIYNEIVDLYMKLERTAEEITYLMESLTITFNKATTTAVRNTVFNELTARLGDGRKPIEGFFDWRGRGVLGLRPLMVQFLCRVQDMAEERLVLAEVNKPEGRTLADPGKDVELNDRWCLMWRGKCIVQSALHILDPFREYREICDWYGRRFCFLGNSLMLPFNLHLCIDELNMRQHVTDQLRTKPFLHFGYERQKSNWQFEKFLVQFRRKFLDYSEDNQSFNWPDTPVLNPVTDDDSVFRLYTAILVIYCRCSDSVQRTFEYEKQFVALASTKRGKNLMFGNDGVKEEKFLNIPPGLLKFLEDPTFKRTLKQTKPPEPEAKKVAKPKKLKPIKLIDVLLVADVEGVGKKNKIVKVNEDYAKMYLIPRKLAEMPRKEQSRETTPIKGSASSRGKDSRGRGKDSKTPSPPQRSRPGSVKPGSSSSHAARSSTATATATAPGTPAAISGGVSRADTPAVGAATGGGDTSSDDPNKQNTKKDPKNFTGSDVSFPTPTGGGAGIKPPGSSGEDKLECTAAVDSDKKNKTKTKERKSTAMSKATIVAEIQSSRNVTRLPPVTGSEAAAAKMTRRVVVVVDGGRPPTPNTTKK